MGTEGTKEPERPDIIDKCTVIAFFCNREVTCLRDIKGININSRERKKGKRVKHNCKHTEWEDKTIGMRA